MDKVDRFFILLNFFVIALVLGAHSCSIKSLEDQLDQIRLSVKQESATQSLSTDASTTTPSDTTALPLGDN